MSGLGDEDRLSVTNMPGEEEGFGGGGHIASGGNTVEQAKKKRMKRIRKEAEEVLVPSKLFWCFFCGQHQMT